jgi:Hypervirulence associated proteins TUDOR domain
MAKTFQEGAIVRWDWSANVAHGKVEQRFDKQVSRTIKGKRVTRNGTPENPAYLIRQADGDRVLKRSSELEPGE